MSSDGENTEKEEVVVEAETTMEVPDHLQVLLNMAPGLTEEFVKVMGSRLHRHEPIQDFSNVFKYWILLNSIEITKIYRKKQLFSMYRLSYSLTETVAEVLTVNSVSTSELRMILTHRDELFEEEDSVDKKRVNKLKLEWAKVKRDVVKTCIRKDLKAMKEYKQLAKVSKQADEVEKEVEEEEEEKPKKVLLFGRLNDWLTSWCSSAKKKED